MPTTHSTVSGPTTSSGGVLVGPLPLPALSVLPICTYDRQTCVDISQGELWVTGYGRELAALDLANKLCARAGRAGSKNSLLYSTLWRAQSDAIRDLVKECKARGLLLHLVPVGFP